MHRLIMNIHDEENLGGVAIEQAVTAAIEGFPFSVDAAYVYEPEQRMERAKAKARELVGGLLPGNTGLNFADELAEKILVAADGEED